MPVTDAVFSEILQGNKEDHQIEDTDVVLFAIGGDQTRKVYLMSVAIDPDLRRNTAGLLPEPVERLVNGFVNKLYYYAIHYGVRVTELASVGWTSQGQKLCEALGMRKCGEDRLRRPVYWLKFDALPLTSARLFPSVQKLAREYRRMAETE
jgi:hypothetical protein